MANEILASLSNFSNYLVGENKLRKEEFEKEKQKVSAQRIATGFKSVTAANNESDVRQLVYSLINDAASLDSLNANLPLIDSLYKDTINNIKTQKAERQDAALRSYAESEYGVKAPTDLTGAQVFDIAKYNQSLEKDVNTVTSEGVKVLKTFDHKGNEKFSITTDARTDLQQKELGFQFDKRIEDYRHKLNNNNKVFAPSFIDPATGKLILTNKEGYSYTQVQGPNGEPMLEPFYGGAGKVNTKGPYQDAKGKVSFYKELNGTDWNNLNNVSSGLANFLGIQPIDTGKDGQKSFAAALDKYDRQRLWNKILVKLNQSGLEGDAYKQEKIKRYNEMNSYFASKEGLQSSYNEVKKAEAEMKYGLGLDKFEPYNELGYNLMQTDVTGIPSDQQSPDGIAKLLNDGKLDSKTATAWLLKYYVQQEALAHNTTLRTNEDFQNYYNKLGFDTKAKIFSYIK